MAFPTYMPYQQTGGYYAPRQDYMSTQFPLNTSTPPAGAQTAQNGFTCRPVASREEALGVPSEFGGMGTLMPDLGHGMIYLKRFDQNTGLSQMLEFAYQQPAQAVETPAVKYATLDDIAALRAEIEALRTKGGEEA